MIISIIKMGIALASFVGIMMLFHHKLQTHIALAPFCSAACIISLSFCGGLLNLLPQTVFLLYAAGFISLLFYCVQYIRPNGKEKVLSFLAPSTVVFALLCVCAIFYYRDIIFHIPDELAHWGTVVRDMCTIKGLPDARSVILNKDYPPGSALFIYYFLSATGFSESICYIAQAILAACCILPFFCGIQWKRIWGMIPAAIAVIVVLNASAAVFSSLLVDYLIPLFALSLLIFILENEELLSTHPVQFALQVSPMGIALCLLKSNGIFLYVMCLVVLRFMFRRHLKQNGLTFRKEFRQKSQLKALLLYATPVISLFLWRQYTNKAYLGQGYDVSKFAVTADNLLGNFHSKPTELIVQILRDLVVQMFTNQYFIFILICALVAFICFKLNKTNRSLRSITLFSIVLAFISWFGYLIGYGLMLIFLMPKWEFDSYGITMIGFDRYVGTIAGFCIGIMVYCILKQCLSFNHRYTKFFIPAFSICFAIVLSISVGLHLAPMVQYSVDPQATYLYEFNAKLDKSLYNSNDTLICYTGEYADNDTTWFSHFYFVNTFSCKNVYTFSNHTVEARQSHPQNLLRYLMQQSNFLVKTVDHENFAPLLAEHNISVDDPSGFFFAVEYDYDTQQISLKRLQ